MSTLREVLDKHRNMIGDTVASELERDLLIREDNMADQIRLAGVQFGVYSEIVAEVLASVGIGSPIPDEQRAFIRAQFNDLMARLRRDYEQGGGGQ